MKADADACAVDVQLTDQIACVERELKMRRRVYPRWVSQGKLQQVGADLELQRMTAVLRSLVALRDGVALAAPDAEAARVAERERVLVAFSVHVSTNVFLRVAAQVRAI